MDGWLSEEARVQKNAGRKQLKAYRQIPYALINQEIDGSISDFRAELMEICQYYKAYKVGISFTVEGTNGDYVPATMKYKMVSTLINKEARFLFAEAPDMKVEAKGDVGKITSEAADELTRWNDLLSTVLDRNLFEKILIQAAKDCFIGKRVACLVNFNEEDGIVVSFLPSTQFIYETRLGNGNIITKFVCFQIIRDDTSANHRRVFKKKYTLEDGVVYVEEHLYDGAGVEVSSDEFEPVEKQATLMHTIPAVVFINDGLTGDDKGESEVEALAEYEQWYSKLSNADIDAERKGMNPTRYTVDMDNRSTKHLSSGAGAFWDLMSDQNLDKPSPQVGVLESSMGYSSSLKTTLDRIKTTGYEQIDMPNITLETMVGAITSGKALKAIYWPLVVRCKEKMKMWGPQLRRVIDIIFEGALAYPNCIEQYVDQPLSPVAYEPVVVSNTPLPEDEMEEKQMDLSEVQANVMSKKAYMQKWRALTDDEVEAELEQMAKEREILDDSAMMPQPLKDDQTTPNSNMQNGQEITDGAEGDSGQNVDKDIVGEYEEEVIE